MHAFSDWSSWYNYSVSGWGEPHVPYISKKEMCCMCYFIDCQANILAGHNTGMNERFILSNKEKTWWVSLLRYAHLWCRYLNVICILFEYTFAFSYGCNSSMWTLSNEYLKCSVEKSHFRVQWLFWSCSSGQLWNIRPCKACLFNQFPYFQLLTLLLCMLRFPFFFPLHQMY